jgi:hypothetical protein
MGQAFYGLSRFLVPACEELRTCDQVILSLVPVWIHFLTFYASGLHDLMAGVGNASGKKEHKIGKELPKEFVKFFCCKYWLQNIMV